MRLVQHYDYKNPEGAELEILTLKRARHFAGGFKVLVVMNGRKHPSWLSVDWFVPPDNTSDNTSDNSKE
jgi:hypothetical protein